MFEGSWGSKLARATRTWFGARSIWHLDRGDYRSTRCVCERPLVDDGLRVSQADEPRPSSRALLLAQISAHKICLCTANESGAQSLGGKLQPRNAIARKGNNNNNSAQSEPFAIPAGVTDKLTRLVQKYSTNSNYQPPNDCLLVSGPIARHHGNISLIHGVHGPICH